MDGLHFAMCLLRFPRLLTACHSECFLYVCVCATSSDIRYPLLHANANHNAVAGHSTATWHLARTGVHFHTCIAQTRTYPFAPAHTHTLTHSLDSNLLLMSHAPSRRVVESGDTGSRCQVPSFITVTMGGSSPLVLNASARATQLLPPAVQPRLARLPRLRCHHRRSHHTRTTDRMRCVLPAGT